MLLSTGFPGGAAVAVRHGGSGHGVTGGNHAALVRRRQVTLRQRRRDPVVDRGPWQRTPRRPSGATCSTSKIPSKLVDEAKVAAAQAAVEQAKDPLERLKALARPRARPAAGHQRGRAATSSPTPRPTPTASRSRCPRSGRWVCPPTCWPGPGSRCGPVAPAGTTASGAPRQRAPRVSLDVIKAAAVRLPRQFTLNDLAEKAGGGSQGTLRKAVDDLVAEGKVRKVGPVPNYRGRGRAPDPLRTGLTRVASPTFEVEDPVEVAPGAGLEVGALRVGDGDERALHHVLGEPEQLGRVLLVDEVQRGPAGPEPTGPRREAEVPRGRQQRAPDGGVQRDRVRSRPGPRCTGSRGPAPRPCARPGRRPSRPPGAGSRGSRGPPGASRPCAASRSP